MQVLTPNDYLQTEAGSNAKAQLQRMVTSTAYTTTSSYNASEDRTMAFVDRHISYLAKHPGVSPVVYLANLRVMTKASR